MKLCTECGVEPKADGKHRCRACHLRRQPIAARIDAAQARLGMIPPELRRERVAPSAWPAGRRWCSGCQSFVLFADVASGSAQCAPCVSRKAHDRRLRDVYGIDAEEYRRILVDVQGGRCAICNGYPRGSRFAVDHDHKTGAVRGILCARCNHDLLGAAHDSTRLLVAALAYLTYPPAQGSWPGRSPRVEIDTCTLP